MGLAVLVAGLLSLKFVSAQTAEERAKYAEFAAAVEPLGYTWKPYKVKTDDGWHLTFFRVTGRNGERPALESGNVDKPPVLC